MKPATRSASPVRLAQSKKAYTESIALAFLPQPVQQKDGSSRSLCWTGRINRAQRIVNGENDADRRVLLLQAYERLRSEYDAVMQRMADAEAQYRELCAAAGVPVEEVKAECTCEWCRNNQKTLKHNMMAKVTS